MDVTIEYICFICIIVPLIMMTITLPGKGRLIIGSMGMGLFISLLSSEVSGAIIRELKISDMLYITTNITPLIEEILKALPILIYAFLFAERREILLSCAFGIGVGFAVLENIVILLRAVMVNPESANYLWAFVRGFGSGLMHAVTTMMVAIIVNFVKKQRKLILPGVTAMLCVAAAYHAIYNALVQSDLKYLGFVLPLITYAMLSPLTFKGRFPSKKKKGVA
ncbi:MAG: PrsW family intramembrane metalloprotease [Lachnospiraceae bacterium]|nr:PrsW family intramembrane metalloprotease [Lachnospiraceae bacterium]